MEDVSFKYLNYWWNPDSEVDPSQTSEDYFKVFYDEQERYIIVERYDINHSLKSHDRFFWDSFTLIKVEVYDQKKNMQKYIIYSYDGDGLIRRDHYSPEGKLLLSEFEDE